MAPATMPRVGDMVRYVLGPGDGKDEDTGKIVPALVVTINSELNLDLHVFLPRCVVPTIWRTDVIYDHNRSKWTWHLPDEPAPEETKP